MALPPVRQPIAPVAGLAARPDAGRAAAQKAFFEAALGKPSAAPAPAAPVTAPPVQAASQSPAQAAARVTALPDDPPKKILRPGSLIDIRV
jgi:hypothetical protein